ncbi:MAG TPA: DUF4190 domain-containing protein [Gemmataceae bacterium]|nr:DUF4190 domain-containing protein [Gemmataceae bacterium]
MSDSLDDYDDDVSGRNVEPHRGVLILVLGILGLMVCGIIGIFAWMFGKRDLDLMKRGLMDKEGEALTRVGYILGIVGTILFLIAVLVVGLYFTCIAIVIANK